MFVLVAALCKCSELTLLCREITLTGFCPRATFLSRAAAKKCVCPCQDKAILR